MYRYEQFDQMASTRDAAIGVDQLLEDLKRLHDQVELADVFFFAGTDEQPLHAHRLILSARCSSFKNCGQSVICEIPGTTVSTVNGHDRYNIRWPSCKKEVLKTVMFYIYTGRIGLCDNDVFDILAVASDLGIVRLVNQCQEYILSSLNVHNACLYYPSALNLQTRGGSDEVSSSFVEQFTQFIGERAVECFKSDSFLQLPKDALIQLISSDHLALSENDVWRRILAWARHQANVHEQMPGLWTEEERNSIGVQLAGVIDHVRILLIDSHVFAEEVEPTGVLPIEVSYERYKYAALPEKMRRASSDPRCRPRMFLHLFSASQILSGEKSSLQRVLNEFYGQPKQSWRLLHRASVNGFDAEAFHRNCDNMGPTMTIVASVSGHICAAFTDVPWTSGTKSGRYFSSSQSFICFLYRTNSSDAPVKFGIKKKSFAVVHHPNFGPVFGAGSDLSISDKCNSNSNSYSNLLHSYDCEILLPSKFFLMGSYNFTVKDYEVFSLA